MGTIRESETGESRQLEAEHLVGRAALCSLRINQRFVSAQHATLRWSGQCWNLKDLGSRNGTYLDGTKVRPGAGHSLQVGARIGFGRLEQQWELVDSSPPCVMAIPLHGHDPVLVDSNFLALPSGDDPKVTIYPNSDGSWVLEQPGEFISPITNQQTFDVNGQAWKFCCPESPCLTLLNDMSEDIEMRHVQLAFSVSRDEEHVQIHATVGFNSLDLGSRTHNYLLLMLARRRLSDATEGLPETTCGWIYQEDLAYQPDMDPQQLNVDVYRIRKQFASLRVSDAANIIERRPRTRQLRIGTGRLSVVTL